MVRQKSLLLLLLLLLCLLRCSNKRYTTSGKQQHKLVQQRRQNKRGFFFSLCLFLPLLCLSRALPASLPPSLTPLEFCCACGRASAWIWEETSVFRPSCLLSGPITEPIQVLFRTNFRASHWLETFEPSRVPSLTSDPYSEPGSQTCFEPVSGALAWSSSTCEVPSGCV
jgi:hypothetical protein